MKNGLLLWLLFVASCVPAQSPTASPTAPPAPSPTVSPTAPPIMSSTDYPTPLPAAERLRRALALDERCPHLCWLGINPGITSAEEARNLLEAADEVDQLNITRAYIELAWRSDYYISVSFEKGLVQSIYLYTKLAFAILGEFIQFLGNPDEIRIAVFQNQHCDDVTYLIYYTSRKTALFVRQGSWNGPHSEDFVSEITLNTEFDDEALRERYLQPLGINNDYLSDRQPWLGFEHLQDYLPDHTLPTGPCVLPGAAP